MLVRPQAVNNSRNQGNRSSARIRAATPEARGRSTAHSVAGSSFFGSGAGTTDRIAFSICSRRARVPPPSMLMQNASTTDDPSVLVARKRDPGPLFPWPRVLASCGLRRVP